MDGAGAILRKGMARMLGMRMLRLAVRCRMATVEGECPKLLVGGFGRDFGAF